MTIALAVALFASVAQLFSGHSSAKLVGRYQPPKLAAMEGHYTTGPADLYLWGVVNEENQSVSGIRLPNMLSFLIHGDPEAPITGLNDVPRENRPPVQIVFQSFHIMVLIGFMLIGLNVLGAIFYCSGKLFETRWLLWAFVLSVLGPQVANQVGWVTAEVGRQPWIVYGLLRTSEGLSKAVTANMVVTSLIMFTIVYMFLFVLFIFLLDKK